MTIFELVGIVCYAITLKGCTTWKGAYANLRRCLYGKDAYEYSLEYAEQFWEQYADEPKFFRLGFIDGHEGSLEVIKYLDEPLLNMIKKVKVSLKTLQLFLQVIMEIICLVLFDL